MSNVLIGIIGVILFIGLAIAGAVFLGDDFMTASASTQAAAAMQQVSQTQAAVGMWRLKTGSGDPMTQDTSFLVPRFLKIAAINPTTFGRANLTRYSASVHLNDDLDLDQNDQGKAMVAGWVMMEIGSNQDKRARDVCLEIEQQNGRTSIANQRQPANPTGCSDWNGSFVVYGRL